MKACGVRTAEAACVRNGVTADVTPQNEMRRFTSRGIQSQESDASMNAAVLDNTNPKHPVKSNLSQTPVHANGQN